MLRWKRLWNSFWKRKSKWLTVVIPVTLLASFFFLISLTNVYSQTYDIERFNRAKETIRSPITIENESETDRKTRETVQAVSDRYTTVDEITKEQIGYIEEIVDAIDSIESDDSKEEISNEEKVLQLNDILSKDITESVDDIILMQLVQLDKKERDEGKKIFMQAIEKALTEGARIENIQSGKEEVASTLKYATLNDEVKSAFNKLIDFSIVENAFFDVERTMEARNKAASSVDPVMIQSGDIIVREGQIITKEMYEDLRLVGLLNNERNIYPSVGLLLFVILISGIIMYELMRLYKRNQWSMGKMVAVFFITVIIVTGMKTASLYTDQLNHLYFLLPIATGVLLLKLLVYERFSIIMALIYAVLGSIIFNGQIPGSLNMEVFIYFLFFQLAGIFLLSNLEDRIPIVKTAIGMAIVNLMMILMFLFLSFEKFQPIKLLVEAGFGIAAAVLSVVFTMGLLPFFESGLGILTDNRLLKLANPNQPLIRKILVEAPGTYHHSVMVANLSETACEAIGANGLLARVGAYYHDIGKTVKPQFFIENQVSIRNPHDSLPPTTSADIIIHHAIDGVRMLREHRLPQEIIDIAAQHHGTSLVQYFYQMELKQNPETKETDFRYPGPKPFTKEAGIISICDSVEAAVRSLQEPSAGKIDEIVLSIMNAKLMDGQLDETPLTFKELRLVRETVCEALKGIFHSRIQYPDKEAT